MIKKYYLFSRFLENIKTEKWVLNFYQMDFFPIIGLDNWIRKRIRRITSQLMEDENSFKVSMGRLIDRLLNQIEFELNVEREFPHGEISKLFYRVNATFFSFFINLLHLCLTEFSRTT